MSNAIPNITPPQGLKPKAKYFSDVGEDCINMDGVIELARRTDTPQARAIYRAFRRRHAELRLSMADATPEKVRETAMLRALEDCGHKITFKKIRGTM